MRANDHERVGRLSGLTGTRVDIAEELRRGYAEFWVACDGDGAVSYALVWWVADEMQLVDTATLPPERRRGAARQLLQGLLGEARERRCQRAELEVRAGNTAALGLYQGLGFEIRRRRPGYYEDGEDALELAAQL